jgi:hypothetical protein
MHRWYLYIGGTYLVYTHICTYTCIKHLHIKYINIYVYNEYRYIMSTISIT